MAEALNIPDHVPNEEVVRMAKESSDKLEPLLANGHRLRLVGDTNPSVTIEIPAEAGELLFRLLTEMAKGNAVAVYPIHAQLTTQEAADLLGVSRPFVVKEIDAKKLPAKLIGKHRRIVFKDLMEYMRRSDLARQQALDDLAALDQELGIL